MNEDIHAQLKEFIKEIEDNRVSSTDAINKITSLWNLFEESFLMQNSEIELLDIKKTIITGLLERKGELREHNSNLNKILFLQAIGVPFEELEIKDLLANDL